MLYDCFLFFNELEILDLRLRILGDVDRFVILESDKTFSGKPKPYVFEENRSRFKSFLPKIVHVKHKDVLRTTNPWDREIDQRNSIEEGIREAKEEDVIMLSDVDEVPPPEVLGNLTCEEGLIAFSQTLFYYFLNLQGKLWVGTRAFKKGYLFGKTLERIRRAPPQKTISGGWHFTYQGGESKILEKLDSFSHQEANTPEIRKGVGERMSDFKCLWMPERETYTLIERGSGKLPKEVEENWEEYVKAGMIFERKMHGNG